MDGNDDETEEEVAGGQVHDVEVCRVAAGALLGGNSLALEKKGPKKAEIHSGGQACSTLRHCWSV